MCVADAPAVDIARCDVRLQQDVGESGGLGRCVPAIDVERGVGFGDTALLHFGQRLVEATALLPSRSSMKLVVLFTTPRNPITRTRRQCLAYQIEDRHAVHDGAFEQKPAVGACGGPRQRAIGACHRPLIGGDGVRAAAQRRADVARRRFATFDIQRRGFDDDQPSLLRGGGAALQRHAKKRREDAVRLAHCAVRL